jgi:hypothetical protein
MRQALRLPPILRALLALLAAIVVAAGLLRLARWLFPALGPAVAPLPAWLLAIWVGAVAALLGRPLGLERWWSALLIALPPAFVLLLQRELGAGWYGALFVVLVGIYWSTFRTRVPLYLSGHKARAALLALLPGAGTPLRFIDLGCGFGGVTLALAQARPDGAFTGVELAPLPAWIGQMRAQRGPRNARILRGSLWDQPLGDYDLAYAFLSPVPMPALWEKARREMRAGSLFISNTFAVPGVPPDEVVAVGDLRGTQLLVWRMGPQRGDTAAC